MTPRKLRIGVFGLNYAPELTGIAPYTTGLASGLAKRGHDVRVLTGYPHYPEWRIHAGYSGLTTRDQIDDVSIKRLRHLVPDPTTIVGRTILEATFGTRLIASRWEKLDVLLCISPALISTAMTVTRARFQKDRPAIGVWVQDLYSRGVVETGRMGPRGAAVMKKIERETLAHADGVAVIHDRFKQHAVTELGLTEESICVIRNWSHVATEQTVDRNGIRQQFGWRPDDLIAIHAGNMGLKQNLEVVVEAARIAERDPNNRVRFVLIGDGNQRHSLEKLAEGVSTIQFIDHLLERQFASTLASADILLVNERPELREMAVPSKLTSYFGAGRPILAATECNSITASECRNSGAAVVIPPGNPAALLTAARNLGEDAAKCEAYGMAGRTYRDRLLSADTAVDQFEHWIASLYHQRVRSTREGGSTK